MEVEAKLRSTSPQAIRSRRFRERRKAGEIPIQFVVRPGDVELLRHLNFLPAEGFVAPTLFSTALRAALDAFAANIV